MFDNKDLYPTPDFLIAKMLSKVDFRNKQVKNILEPSAGLGHIIDYINKEYKQIKGSELAIIINNVLLLK